jgi:hypothetical protein
MKRRTLLQLLGSLAATLPRPGRLFAQASPLGPSDEARLHAVAEVVLPDEIGAAGRDAAVKSFLGWIRDYRADAETDHGYGFTRLRRTGPSPAANYATQLNALDDEARKRGRSFVDLPVAERQSVIEAAITAAKIDRLPGRPDGGHIATDLMASYFRSIEANDLCYRAKIGRDTCRGLNGSVDRPASLTSGGR